MMTEFYFWVNYPFKASLDHMTKIMLLLVGQFSLHCDEKEIRIPLCKTTLLHWRDAKVCLLLPAVHLNENVYRIKFLHWTFVLVWTSLYSTILITQAGQSRPILELEKIKLNTKPFPPMGQERYEDRKWRLKKSWVWARRYLYVRTFYVLRQLKKWWLLAHLLHHQSLHVFVISIQQLKLVGEGKGDLCFGQLTHWVLLAGVICIQSSFTWVSEFHIHYCAVWQQFWQRFTILYNQLSVRAYSSGHFCKRQHCCSLYF